MVPTGFGGPNRKGWTNARGPGDAPAPMSEFDPIRVLEHVPFVMKGGVVVKNELPDATRAAP